MKLRTCAFMALPGCIGRPNRCSGKLLYWNCTALPELAIELSVDYFLPGDKRVELQARTLQAVKFAFPRNCVTSMLYVTKFATILFLYEISVTNIFIYSIVPVHCFNSKGSVPDGYDRHNNGCWQRIVFYLSEI